MAAPAMIPSFVPRRTLSKFPAPRFCPANVLRARERLTIGNTAKPSNFDHAPQPAMAWVSKRFMPDCTNTFERAIMQFWNAAGTPSFMICFTEALSAPAGLSA